ncbi:MAG: hypothetical protein Kow0059_09290 [Candidatus Sumerlaeia bacterium]
MGRNMNCYPAMMRLTVILAVLLPALSAGSPAQSAESALGSPLSLANIANGELPGVAWDGSKLAGFTGAACASAGDVDADGFSDILIALPQWDSGATAAPEDGCVFLIFGRSAPFNQEPIQPLTGFSPTTMIQFIGANGLDQTGWSVSGAGDVNGDGYADFLIGAPGYKSDSGLVYLIYGGPRYLLLQQRIIYLDANPPADRMIRIHGGSAGLRAGTSVSGAGDFNGDGFDDIVIGVPFGNGGKGEAAILFGRSGPLDPSGAIDLRTFEYGNGRGLRVLGYRPGSTAGWSVSGVADFNLDGRWEVLIGAPYATGTPSNGADEAFLIFGHDPADSSDGLLDLGALTETTGLRLHHQFSSSIGLGMSVSGIGDTNGDGLGDILIGAPLMNQNRGLCVILFGALQNPGGPAASLDIFNIPISAGGVLTSGMDDLLAGWSVAGAGDANNDGYQDFIIGGPGPNPPATPPSRNLTRAWLVFGSPALFSDGLLELDFIDTNFQGQTWLEADSQNRGGLAGFCVAGAGDFNHDYLFDVLIGAPGEERCYLVFNQPQATPSGYLIRPWQGNTPPLPIGILGDGSHALPLTRSWIDFSFGLPDPQAPPTYVYFDAMPFPLYPYNTRVRYSWSVGANRFNDPNIRFFVKGTQTAGAGGWYDVLYWSQPGYEYPWVNQTQTRDPVRTLISAPLPDGFEFFEMGVAPDLEGPRIERVVLVDRNDNGVADEGEKLVLIFDRAILYLGQLTQSEFFLPVQGDSLGESGFTVTDNPVNRRQLLLTLGTGAKLTVPGVFDMSQLGAGAPSGLDLAAARQDVDVVSLLGVPAVDNGTVGVDDTAIDIRFDFIGQSRSIGVAGGVVGLVKSADAEFTGHQLIIEPNSIAPTGQATAGLAADPIFSITHPDENLGVINAAKIQVDRDSFEFLKPAKLRLQYLDSEFDRENGYRPIDSRIFIQVAQSRWVALTGRHIVNQRDKYVEVEILSLQPQVLPGLNATQSTGVSGGTFGNIPGETVEEASILIKPSAAGAAAAVMSEIGLVAAPVLKPGPRGAYTLHEIEFPGYELATTSDPDRIKVKIRKPLLFDIYTTHGTNEVPGDLSSVFIIETEDPDGLPVAFSDPVNFKVQFFDGSINSYNDVLKFDNMPGRVPDMSLFTDLRDGPDNEYAILELPNRTVQSVTGGGLVVVPNVPNLTGPSGSTLWGAISDNPSSEKHGWFLH